MGKLGALTMELHPCSFSDQCYWVVFLTYAYCSVTSATFHFLFSSGFAPVLWTVLCDVTFYQSRETRNARDEPSGPFHTFVGLGQSPGIADSEIETPS